MWPFDSGRGYYLIVDPGQTASVNARCNVCWKFNHFIASLFEILLINGVFQAHILHPTGYIATHQTSIKGIRSVERKRCLVSRKLYFHSKHYKKKLLTIGRLTYSYPVNRSCLWLTTLTPHSLSLAFFYNLHQLFIIVSCLLSGV